MNLKKMLLLVSMALTAIAFAVPAAAQAQEHGLTEEGEFLKPGAPVTLTSTNLKTVTAAGTLGCGKVTLHYHVDTNTDEHVELDPTPEATKNVTTENCVLTTSGGTKHTVHFSNAGTHKLTLNTWGTGTAEATFTTRFTFGAFTVHCVFSGKIHFQATSGTDNVHIGPSKLTGTGFGCPTESTISCESTAETPDGTPLELDFVKT